MKFNSLDIMRNVMLASVLEPIPEKDGCTTRYHDWQDKIEIRIFFDFWNKYWRNFL